MAILTPEQFKQKYGQAGLDQFSNQKQEAGGFINRIKETGRDLMETGSALKDTFTSTNTRIGEAKQAYNQGEQGFARTLGQNVGLAAGGLSRGLGEAFIGAGKAVLPQEAEDAIKSGLTTSIQYIAPIAQKVDEFVGKPVGTFMKNYQNLDPKTKRDVDALFGVASLGVDIATFGAGKAVKEGVETGIKTGIKTGTGIASGVGGAVAGGVGKARTAIGQGVSRIGETRLGEGVSRGISAVGDRFATPIAATKQVGTELAERVPRAIERVKESSGEAIARGTKIKESVAEVGNAVKAKLDDRIINTIAEVDDATRQAFKRVVDIAEETPKTIGLKKQPSIVSGELAVEQFNTINKQRKTIGEALGEAVSKLSKTTKVNVEDSIRQLNDVLASQGITITKNKAGKLIFDFRSSKFTTAERNKIKELYTLATEGGKNLSPLQIRGKDQLFSKLQREAAMDVIGKIMVETADGNQSLFGIFRDIFSGKLDTLSPAIRGLNKQYRDLTLMIDDVNKSILKTPNFNAIKSADPAEFAKVNLRRIFGEAQSSPVFEAVANQMDALARTLGYKGATPKQVADFAQELRKLYPESIPKAGFTGGISTGVKSALGDLVGGVLKAGAPNLADQRKALKELLDFYLKKTKTPVKK